MTATARSFPHRSSKDSRVQVRSSAHEDRADVQSSLLCWTERTTQRFVESWRMGLAGLEDCLTRVCQCFEITTLGSQQMDFAMKYRDYQSLDMRGSLCGNTAGNNTNG